MSDLIMDKIQNNKKQPGNTRKKTLKKDTRSMWTVQGFTVPQHPTGTACHYKCEHDPLPVVTFLTASRERYERRKNRDGALIQGS